ncbi:MAG: RsmB/NOP family class I SAM-dependent RNA methyltransferase [Dermatophilaceae bacterium]
MPEGHPGSTGRPRNGSHPPRRPAERSRTADAARLAAYTVMRAVDAGAYANLELSRVLRERRVRGRDAAFATELTYGATRLRGRYDPIIAVAAERPLAAMDAPVLDILRLGTHQLLGMRVPAHAATSETVALARQVAGIGSAGFVNAVLRRVGERDLDSWLGVVAPATLPPLERLGVVHSHPPWIVTALRAALIGHGRATADSVTPQLVALLESDNTPAQVALVARPGLAEVAELVAAGASPGPLAPTSAVLPHGDPGSIRAVREGRAGVQDEGSQLVALAVAAADVSAVGAPQQWLDLCAGPGGKAGLLAALARRRGARLVANDVSEHRSELVRATLAPLLRSGADTVQVRTMDGRDIGGLEPGRYDRVLVDAPCTGLGALRRRPEARWRRSPADLPALTRLQRELLASAVEATRAGGVVGYATCSPHLSETRFAVEDVVKRRHDVDVVDARGLFRDRAGEPVADLGDGPFVQLWPHVHGTDGMFFALVRKKP